MPDYPVEQHKADRIQRRGRLLVEERLKEVINGAVNSDVAALDVIADGNSAKQDSQHRADQIQGQRIDAKRFKETRPTPLLALDIDKVDKHSLDAHRHATGDQHKRR